MTFIANIFTKYLLILKSIKVSLIFSITFWTLLVLCRLSPILPWILLVTALSLADFLYLAQSLMKSSLDLHSLRFNVIWTIVEVFFLDFLYFGCQGKSTFEKVSLVQLLLGVFAHHWRQFDAFLPILGKLTLTCTDLVHAPSNWRMIYMIFYILTLNYIGNVDSNIIIGAY